MAIEYNMTKIELMQEKNLVHKLYMCTAHGSENMTPKENEQLAEMILKRRGKDES